MIKSKKNPSQSFSFDTISFKDIKKEIKKRLQQNDIPIN